ncbi:MAG: ATP-binding cassette domain-containing protein [Chloroflexota bacterium]
MSRDMWIHQMVRVAVRLGYPPDVPIVEIDKLVKRYKGAHLNAVDGVSLAIEEGEFFALLGPNGAGKTTTISIVTTTLSPTSGTVRVAGYDAFAESSAVRRQVGIIFQRPSLDRNLSAEENIRVHAFLYGLYPFRPTYRLMPAAYRDQVHHLATILGIDADLFKPIKTFSGGMTRKLEIIRSLMHKPRVLFLDEPTLGLDPISRRALWEYLVDVRAAVGTTIFLTTHYLEEAEQADRVCVIDRGRVIAQGTPAQRKAQMVEDYLLIDAADRAALCAELRHLSVHFEEPSSSGPIRVDVRGSRVHQLLKQIQLPLTDVRTHSPSLEDAYLQIIRAAEEA